MEQLVLEMKNNDHANAKFASAAFSLWFRFGNFTERNAPYASVDAEGNITAVVMLTLLTREPYANLYEIFAVESGCATSLYWEVMKHAKENGAERLKMSCTPSSIGWHFRNGIVGWGTDPTGSIRVDIPICDSRQEQIELRERAIECPILVMPEGKAKDRLAKEENSFGPKKIIQVENAIDFMGMCYMRKHIV